MQSVSQWLAAISCALLLLAPGALRAATQLPQALQQARKQGTLTEQQAQKTLNLVQQDKQQLQKRLQQLQRQLQAQQQQLDQRQQQFSRLKERTRQLDDAIADEKQAIAGVRRAVHSAADKTQKLFRQSLVTGQYPQRLQALEPLLRQETFPGLEGIRQLVDMLFAEIERSSAIRHWNSDIITASGATAQAGIVRVGGLTAVYQQGNKNGFLQLQPDGDLQTVAAQLSLWQQQAVSAYMQQKKTSLPVDISHGQAFRVLAQGKTLWEWLRTGGFLIWPLLVIAAAGLLMALERIWWLLRIRTNAEGMLQTLLGYIQQQDYEACRAYCQRHQRRPLCRVSTAVLDQLGATQDVVENAVQEALLRQLPRLERFLPTLAVLGAIAPLLGLLGTVTGMINTFQAITLFGTGDPKLMSGGISEALITTQVGLGVAIPLMLVHHLLERRVDRLLTDMEEKAQALVQALRKQGAVAPPEERHGA